MHLGVVHDEGPGGFGMSEKPNNKDGLLFFYGHDEEDSYPYVVVPFNNDGQGEMPKYTLGDVLRFKDDKLRKEFEAKLAKLSNFLTDSLEQCAVLKYDEKCDKTEAREIIKAHRDWEHSGARRI